MARRTAARARDRAAVRRAKNEWLTDVAEQAQAGRSRGGSIRTSSHTIQRCFHGLRRVPSRAVKSEDGLPGSSTEELNAWWHRHFTKVLNIESIYNSEVFDSLRARPICHELDDLPTADELARAIARLSNNKAPGESGIVAEMVRHAGPEFSASLLSLLLEVWREGCVPQAWRDAELVPIPKKGDLLSCDNWRGIALLDVIGKVVGRLVQSCWPSSSKSSARFG